MEKISTRDIFAGTKLKFNSYDNVQKAVCDAIRAFTYLARVSRWTQHASRIGVLYQM